jgi:hypothetical protein
MGMNPPASVGPAGRRRASPHAAPNPYPIEESTMLKDTITLMSFGPALETSRERDVLSLGEV